VRGSMCLARGRSRSSGAGKWLVGIMAGIGPCG
jgi:hypothetical protein